MTIKKTFYNSLISSMFIFHFIPTLVYPQDASWESIGPSGGLITRIIAAPSNQQVIYASNIFGSVFRSNNYGNNWEIVGWKFGQIQDIAVDHFDPDIVYVGFGDTVLATYDGGATWEETNWTYGGLVWRLASDPQNTDVFYATSLFRRGIYKSEYGGADWNFLPLPEGAGRIFVLAVNPLSSNIIYVATNGWDFYRSSDYGETWDVNVELPGNPTGMDTDPFNQDVLYLASSEGVLKTQDGGNTWEKRNGGIDDSHPWTDFIIVNNDNPNKLFRCTNLVVYISDDAGISWLETAMPCNSLTIAEDSLLLSGSRDGVYASNLDGEWVEYRSNGLFGSRIVVLALINSNPPGIIAGTEDQGLAVANLYYSQIDSINWDKRYFDRGLSDIEIHPKNPNFIVASYGWIKTGIGFSGDMGDTWEYFDLDDHIFALKFHPSDSSTIFAGGSKLYVSPDLGISWNIIDLPTLYDTIYDIEFGNHSAEIIYLAATTGFDWTYRNVFYRSYDSGITWEEETLPVLSVESFPNLNGVVLTHTNQVLYRSIDYGQTWEEIPLPIENILINTIEQLEDSVVVLGSNRGVFISRDTGRSWEAINESLKSRNVLTVSYIPGQYFNLYVGTEAGGVYRTHIDQSGPLSILGNKYLPASFNLSQNYPNPFNPMTTIEYSLLRPGEVSLVIYNLLGEEVARLVNGEHAAGYHRVSWNASNVASGIYFYRLQAGNFVQTRKLVLLK